MHHSGTITGLQWHSNSHLFTCSEDGTVCIVRSSDWTVLKTIKAHPMHSVTGIAVHPSGKVLLTVGTDRLLRCWDLQTAACAYSVKLSDTPLGVRWSPCGSNYAVRYSQSLHVFQVGVAEPCSKIVTQSRLNCMAFTEFDGLLVLGLENGQLMLCRLDGTTAYQWDSGHQSRIKDLDTVTLPSSRVAATTDSTGLVTLVATCSSNGRIFLWDIAATCLQLASSTTVEPQLGSFDAQCRLTCLCISQVVSKKKESTQPIECCESEMSEYEAPSKPTVTVTMEGKRRVTKRSVTKRSVKKRSVKKRVNKE